MLKNQGVKFQDALEVVESLPEYQQEDLIEVLQHRLVEQRREALADNVKEARKEYAKGQTKKGTIKDLMKDLSE